MILLFFFRLIIVHQLIVGASGYDYAWLAGMLIIHLLVLVPGRQATTDLVVRMTARAMLAMLGKYDEGTLSFAVRIIPLRSWDGLGLVWSMAVLTALPGSLIKKPHHITHQEIPSSGEQHPTLRQSGRSAVRLIADVDD